MGAKSSAPVSPISENDDKLLKDFDLSAPRAAVIGAGLSGVHAAYELAKMGFKVTVFEKRADVALGSSTRHAWPVVGVGSRTPAIWDVPFSRDLFWGVVPFGVPDIYSKDYAYITFFSTCIHRWLYTRRFGGQAASDSNRRAVLQWGQDLSAASAVKVAHMCREHGALAQCAQPLDVLIQTPLLSSTSDDAAVAYPASPKPFLVDPVRWTQSLAEICRAKLGVTFRFETRIVSLSANLRHNREYVGDIRYSTPPSDGSGSFIKAERFDLYVLACGSKAADLANSTVRLPLIDLRGYGLTVPADSQFFKEGVAAIAASPSSSAIVEHKEGGAPPLTSTSNFFIDLLPRNSICAFPSMHSLGDVVISGLYSFDVYSKATPTVQWVTDALSAAVRVHLRRELEPSATASAVGAGAKPFSYSRCVSPDGIPIISNNGRMFNCFVCAGFGDHEADWGPAAAEKLSSIVADVEQVRADTLTPSEDVARNPYSLSRFPRMFPVFVPETPRSVIASTEYTLAEYGKPMQAKLNNVMSDLAKMDGCPLFLRNFVFQHFFEEVDDPSSHMQNTPENVAARLPKLTRAGKYPEEGKRPVL